MTKNIGGCQGLIFKNFQRNSLFRMSDRNSVRTVDNSGESKNHIISKNPFAEKEGICLAWKDVSFSVRQKNDDSKVILRDVSGMVVPGELNSIMGPSGSGKVRN